VLTLATASKEVTGTLATTAEGALHCVPFQVVVAKDQVSANGPSGVCVNANPTRAGPAMSRSRSATSANAATVAPADQVLPAASDRENLTLLGG
jgi:hypothetical protein